jgi:hypothetical protein
VSPPSFARDIAPLIRDRDAEAMAPFFDLRDVEDVRRHAEQIYARVEDGSMPCDAMWSDEQVALLRDWIDAGMPG